MVDKYDDILQIINNHPNMLNISDVLNISNILYKNRSQIKSRKILIIALGSTRDFILSSGVIREIRNKYKTYNIHLLVDIHNYCLAIRCPYVNMAFYFNSNFGIDNYLTFCYNHLWYELYDIVINCTPSEISNYLVLMSNARERYGYEDNLIYTKVFNCSSNMEIDKKFSLAGQNIVNKSLELWLPNVNFAQRYVKKYNHFIVVGVSGMKENERYSYNKLVTVLQKIKENIILVGDKKDAKRAAILGSLVQCKNLVGKIDILTCACIINLSDMYLGNCSDEMYIASVFKKPIVWICKDAKTKEMSYKRFYPYWTKTIVVRPDEALDECTYKVEDGCCRNEPHCINQIAPESIIAAYESMRKEIFDAT